MKATQLLHNLGQSLWLDNITHDLLDSGTLKRYIDELSVTGLTSNPTIFDHAIQNSSAYDAAIIKNGRKGNQAKSWESFRQFLERSDECDRVKELQTRESELTSERSSKNGKANHPAYRAANVERPRRSL